MTSKEEKLTKAQLDLLRLMPLDDMTVHAAPSYKPAQRLVALGLAEWTDGTFPRLRSTEAGRTALERSGG